MPANAPVFLSVHTGEKRREEAMINSGDLWWAREKKHFLIIRRKVNHFGV
ncbi:MULTISPECIES: hypothetical protein [Rahnella]|nr:MULTISPECIES: hypothetical protein [Rahnella]UHM93356.1 hypothetical protein J9880_22025 [Rahnella victoriana]